MLTRLKQLERRTALWAGLLLAVLLAGGGYYGLIAPMQTENALLRAPLEAKETKVAQLAVIARDRNRTVERGAQIYAAYLKAAKLLPDEQNVTEVLHAVEQQAGEKGLEVLGYNAFQLGGKSKVSDQVYERIVEAKLRGNHNALVAFMRNLSYHDRITEIRNLAAIAEPQHGETLYFLMAAYYLPTKVSVPADVSRRAEEILASEPPASGSGEFNLSAAHAL